MENVACRIEEESPSGRAVVQGRLADGVVSALACAEDPSALQAAGEHVVKVRDHPMSSRMLFGGVQWWVVDCFFL